MPRKAPPLKGNEPWLDGSADDEGVTGGQHPIKTKKPVVKRKVVRKKKR